MQKIIEFEDKVALYHNSNIPDINKVNDTDMNEIKSVVNGSLQGTNAMGSIVVDDINCKNLLPNNIGSQSINGLTVTRNSDGSLNINGTASAQTEFYFLGQQSVYYPHDSFEVSKTYKYSCVPNNVPNYKAYATVKHSNGTIDYNEDSGSGVNFTAHSGDVYRIFLRIVNGAVVNNVTFKPMVELGTTKTEYVPYKKIIKEENGYVKENTTFYANDFKCRNIYNPALTRSYMWIYNNGEITTSADPNILSGFLKVEKGKKYTISGVPNTFTVRLCSYTGTTTNTFKTCLINNEANVRTFVADADYVVFAVGSGTATALTNIQLEIGEATPYTPFVEVAPSVETIDISSYKTSNVSNVTRAYIQRVGHIYKINIAVTNTSTSSGTVLFENLPFIPAFYTELNAVNNNNSTTRAAYTTDGKITISTAQATTYYINGIIII